MTDWGVQIATLVFFVPDGAAFHAAKLYEAAFGAPPENISTNKNPSAAEPHLTVAQSELDNELNTVIVQPDRVLFQCACPERRDSGPWAWPLEAGIKKLQILAEQAIPAGVALGNCRRSALNLNLLRNVAASSEAVAFISPKMGMEIPADAMDIQFQINRRLQTAVDGMGLNRVMRFSTSAVQNVEMVFNERSAAVKRAKERQLALLLLDVNTIPTGEIIQSQQLEAIMGEIVAEGIRLAQDGTVQGLNATS